MSTQDYIVVFKNLIHRSDVREHHSKTITRFIWDLRPKIGRAKVTGSYDLDTVKEPFDVTLKLNLTFKTLVNAKTQYSKCDRYRHYYQCPLESQHIRIVPTEDVEGC